MNRNSKPQTTEGEYVSYSDLGDCKLWFPHTQRQLMIIDDPTGRLYMADVQALLISPDDIEKGYKMAHEIIVTSQRQARIHFAIYGLFCIAAIASTAYIWFTPTPGVTRTLHMVAIILGTAAMTYAFRNALGGLKTGGIMLNIAHYEKKHDTELYVNLADIQKFIREQNSPWAKTRTAKA